jgi:hypothetical protein
VILRCTAFENAHIFMNMLRFPKAPCALADSLMLVFQQPGRMKNESTSK